MIMAVSDPQHRSGQPRPLCRWALHGLRLVIGLLLAVTAVGKGLDLPGFAKVVGTFQVFPEYLWLPAAVLVTATEALLSVALLTERGLRKAALGSLLLHLGFTAWASVALLRGLAIPNCGCFGVFLARPLTWSIVVEDSVLALLSLVLYGLSRAGQTAAAGR